MTAARTKRRNYPNHTLEEALAIPQKIADERAGKPFKRLLLAESLGIKPSSSNFRDLLSSSYKYGLTEGTEKASEISLTELGKAATLGDDAAKRLAARRKAVMTPSVFRQFFEDYQDRKLPSAELLPKILASEYEVPGDWAEECASVIIRNGQFADLVRDIGGSAHVLLDSELLVPQVSGTGSEEEQRVAEEPAEVTAEVFEETERPAVSKPKPIFIGHGKNKKPLQSLEKFLSSFQIPYKITIEEPHLGRPIPQKVKDTMMECGSAILVFTKDEKFFDNKGEELWRPSENVVHELGAASFLYGDRIVIFKENSLHFPANYQSIGYIEFDAEGIEAKTAELLKELIGFGLVRVTPT